MYKVIRSLMALVAIIGFVALGGCEDDSGDNGADDYPGDSSSTGSVSVGGSVTGEIETFGDEDWFRVSLTAGTAYQFDLEGSPTSMGTLPDTILDLYGTDGSTRLEFNDDGGIDINARITYTPTTAGTYYLAARGFGFNTGTYTLSVIVSPFPRVSARDFDTLIAAGNESPQGIWSDGTTMWVVDIDDDKLFAYNLATKARDASRDFETLDAAGNDSPYGIWSDGTTMWVGDSFDDEIYAYNLATTERDASRDFDTLDAAGNDAPLGIWSDGTTMWVADEVDAKIYAYNLSTKARDAIRDFDTLDAAGNDRPSGIWSDGTTMWVADFDDNKIYAYNLATTERDASRDADTLIAAGNESPEGLWSDGTTMWVADFTDDKIYAYLMP